MRIPISTYRLQLNSQFGFKKAREFIPYLADLGISDIYASPIFHAVKGSLHGYDLVDSNELNPELGTDEDFEGLIGAVKNRNMGWIQDIVPNHMAFHSENTMLTDILENGPASDCYGFFDIDWDHPYENMKGRVLAPFLGRLYSEALENGEIALQYDRDGFSVKYYRMKFPLRIESCLDVLTHRLWLLRRQLGEDNPDFIKFLGVLYALKTLPSDRDGDDRYDQIRFVKRMLWELYSRNSEVGSFIQKNTGIFNGEKGQPGSFDLLDKLLSQQMFRLSFWKVASEEINYRRFFAISSLICLRMEDESVFNKTHMLIMRLLDEEKFTALRVDHIDGLYDPPDYLRRLRERHKETYIIVEKILGLDEELPPTWPIQGTTGYEFLNYLNGIFCDLEDGNAFEEIYRKFAGPMPPYQELLYQTKRLIIQRHMTGDIDNLAHLLKKISSRDRRGIDITLYGLRKALLEILVLFPVYRTYITYAVFSERDRNYLCSTVEKARKRNPGLENEIDFIESYLLFDFRKDLPPSERNESINFAMRFQQLTGPLMAKGFEDTGLYIYNRLISLNEVGGDPERFGISIGEWHDYNRKQAELWPYTLNATSTHDTKRGEDVRARINVLSEIPDEWRQKVEGWSGIVREDGFFRSRAALPDRNEEYFLYQTLLGTFPFDPVDYADFTARIKEYMVKSAREAKVHTNWLNPDISYEEALTHFVERILHQDEGNRFLEDFLPFQKKIAFYGVLTSLSQALIKVTAPGVPDFYRGTELWDLNLVDPDNRRPVDFVQRETFLREITVERDIPGLISRMLSSRENGMIKLFLVYRALAARKEKVEVFRSGSYLPLVAGGKFRRSVIAFARMSPGAGAGKGPWTITIAPRFLVRVVAEGRFPLGNEIWKDTAVELPQNSPSTWKDALTDNVITTRENHIVIGEVFRHLPVALLVSI